MIAIRKVIKSKGYVASREALHDASEYWRGLRPVAVAPRPYSRCGYYFFFVRKHYVGRDSHRCHLGIEVAWSGSHIVALEYQRYARNDPTCCPSRNPKLVEFRVKGSTVRPLTDPPPFGP